MTTQDKILISVLALSDAVWRPFRQADWSPPGPSNIQLARCRFTEGGVAWAGGGGFTARKQSQRDLEVLAEGGLLTPCGAERRSSVRLTGTGETRARALAGLPSVLLSYSKLLDTIRLEASADGVGLMASELWIVPIRNYHEDTTALWKLSLEMCPCLSRGWIESNSDIHGRAWYWATDKGREAAKLPAPTMPTDLPKYSDAANELYYDQTIAARQQLRSQKPTSPSEIGFIPLPVAITLRRPRRKKAQR